MRFARGTRWLGVSSLIVATAAIYVALTADERLVETTDAVAALASSVSQLEQSVTSIRTAQWRDALRSIKSVDLRSDDLQDMGDGFAVGRLRVEAEPGGARIRGQVVNTQSVTHRSAQFRILTRGVSREFTVMSIPSGGSANFSVVIPGIVADSVRRGTIEYQQSTISFRPPP